MSVTKRVISGSAASWAQIAVGIATQIVVVPIYLNYWDVKTYGLWLAIQAIVVFLSMLDFGHQQYLGYEFLRIGIDDRKLLRKYLWSAAAHAPPAVRSGTLCEADVLISERRPMALFLPAMRRWFGLD